MNDTQFYTKVSISFYYICIPGIVVTRSDSLTQCSLPGPLTAQLILISNTQDNIYNERGYKY